MLWHRTSRVGYRDKTAREYEVNFTYVFGVKRKDCSDRYSYCFNLELSMFAVYDNGQLAQNGASQVAKVLYHVHQQSLLKIIQKKLILNFL
uniref:Uncharacterized protein n=1 Tax=Timema poppense TaxID=170557 RepID=A0A7R9D0L0_TIMPO|nr:unnamed protein product [Timema poppensis]